MDPLRLVGTWDFRREVHDHRDGAEYTARGEAALTPEPDGRIRWTEHGTLSWTGGSTPVTRTLYLVRDELLVRDEPVAREQLAAGDGAAVVGPAASWRVTFEDGRDFHPWTVGAVEHPCGLDLYQGGVAVPDDPVSWEVGWRVTGPEKDYTLRTSYALP